MSEYFVELLRGLGRFFAPARRQSPPARPPQPSRVRGVEILEDRLALSAVLPSSPPGDAFVLGGQDTDPSGPTYHWSQPAGPGSHITITYSYNNLLDGSLGAGLSPASIRAAIQEALSRWASVAPLDFVEVPDSGPPPSSADYDPAGKALIRFGDRPIDGPYNVLAYTYYPGSTGLAGDVQFDSSETWSVNPGQGIDLVEVATHEIGHALGMAHEPPPSMGGTDAIMNPVYAGRFHGLGTSFLYQDDINGIRALYGAGVGSVQPLVQVSPPLPANQIQGYVANLYQLVLNRPASPYEVGIWVTINNQYGENAVEQGIEHSGEARAVLVKNWYRQFLGRAASAGEAQGWVNTMQHGASEEQVMTIILGSQEFFNRAQVLFVTGSADQRYITQLYQAALNRAPASSEVTFWVGMMQSRGAMGVSSILMSSMEFRAIGIRADYTTFLGRTPSSAEVNGWATSVASLQGIRDTFLLSGEFVAHA